MITSSKPGSGWEYERNPQWAKANGKLMPRDPPGHVDKIQIQVLRNPQTEVNEVENGSLDWMANQVPPDRYQEVLTKYEGSQFRVEPTVSTYFFWMNTTVAPFDDLKVRQAVNYAIDPRRWNGSTRAGSKAASRSCRRECPADKEAEPLPA